LTQVERPAGKIVPFLKIFRAGMSGHHHRIGGPFDVPVLPVWK